MVLTTKRSKRYFVKDNVTGRCFLRGVDLIFLIDFKLQKVRYEIARG